MKILTFSRFFPAGHPKAGQSTHFVEKIWNLFRGDDFSLPISFIPWTDNYSTLWEGDDYLKAMAVREIKHHTIRAGARFNPGDMASLRVWSGLPRRSKQIEFAQVEVKKTYPFKILFEPYHKAVFWLDGKELPVSMIGTIAKNDGLTEQDFLDWFGIHPKKKGFVFEGQVITWSPHVTY